MEKSQKAGRVFDRADKLVGFSTRNSYIVCCINLVFLLISGGESFATAAIIFGWLPVVFGEKPNVKHDLQGK